ncbi:hypothetical protein ABW19_dt0206074 [Dactylella cylindrospora]|nr:hypothetical protein ABW19_dt0206074 [Dactylella cylindrospora]
MKSTIILIIFSLFGVCVKAAPYGWQPEHSSTALAPTTTECDTATWVPYDYDYESTTPYGPTWYPKHTTQPDGLSTPGSFYPVPSSEPVFTTIPTGYEYGTAPPYGPEETTTLTTVLESTLTFTTETYISYETPSSGPVYVPTQEVPYVPTPVPYPENTPVPSYEPPYPVSTYEPPSPIPYPTPVPYPPGNETTTPGVPGNQTYPTPTPYVPPYQGSASGLVNNGGFVRMIAGLIGMVAVMGVF